MFVLILRFLPDQLMCSSAVGVFTNQLQYTYWFCHFKFQIDSISLCANSTMDAMSFSSAYETSNYLSIFAQALFSNIMTPINGYEIQWLRFIHSLVTFLLSWGRISFRTSFLTERIFSAWTSALLHSLIFSAWWCLEQRDSVDYISP